jgi:integrase
MATGTATRQHGAPLERSSYPGVYRRGRRWVAVYRVDGRQRKRAAATFAEARGLKRAADARAVDKGLGPTLHAWALDWVARHVGDGHDTVREFTRCEYRRLLVTYALAYFGPEVRLAELDRYRLHGFVNWLTHRPGRHGRLRDRSIANAVTPLRGCLRAAAADGLIDEAELRGLVLPRRRGGGPWHRRPESRFLTRRELRGVLAEIPVEWRPLFELLASTGVRISEALALRWSDIDLVGPQRCVRVRRALVRGVVGPPKSRHGIRTLPISIGQTQRRTREREALPLGRHRVRRRVSSERRQMARTAPAESGASLVATGDGQPDTRAPRFHS